MFFIHTHTHTHTHTSHHIKVKSMELVIPEFDSNYAVWS